MSKKYFIAFCLLCILVVILNVIISFRFSSYFFESLAIRREALEKVYHYQLYLSLLKDMETGERGFIITGDRDYLDPYLKALSLLQSPPIKNFIAQELTSPDPEISQKMSLIYQLTEKKLGQFAEIIEINEEQGFEAAKKVVRNNNGKETMDELRNLVNSIIEKKQKKIDLLDNQAKQNTKDTIIFLIVSNTIAACFVALSLYAIYRSIRKMEKKDSELSVALQQLNDSLAMQQAILNSANYGIISTDPGGLITSFNSAAEKMLGYKRWEVIGKYTPLLIHDPQEIENEAIALSKELHKKVLPGFEVFTLLAKQGIAYTREWTYIRKDQSRFPAFLSVTAVKNIQEQIIGYVGVVYDITEHKEIDRLKNELIAITSHEIRSPVTVIKSTLDLLSQKEFAFSDQVRKIVEIGQKNCNHLVRLIEDIIDVQKITIGHVKFKLKKLNVATFLSEVLQSNIFVADRFHVSLICQKNIPPQWAVEADQDRLMQVMNNLISNAIHHTPEGKTVQIGVQKKNSKIRFEIKDQGPGIAEEFQPRIFQKFATNAYSNAEAQTGIGLGLSIAKAIVDKHNGLISFETSPQGSIFWFELPAVETQTPNSE